MRKNPLLVNGLKIGAGVGLLVFLYLRLEDPELLWQQALAADRRMLLLALVTHSVAVALNGLKWHVLLRAQRVDVSLRRLLAFQWTAIFFDNFFPAQVGGDVVRGYSLARETRRTADAAASVLIDRITGLTAFMLATALASTAMAWTGTPRPATPQELTFLRFVDLELIRMGSLGASAVLLVALALMLSRRTKRWVERAIAHLPLLQRLLPLWQAAAGAINAYRHAYPAMFLAGLISGLIVGVTSITVWLLANAVQPNSIDFLSVLVINPIIGFLTVIPLSPGGLGVRQVAFSALFVTVGVSPALGFLVGLLQQVVTYVVSLPGLLLWIRGQGISQEPVAPSSGYPPPDSPLPGSPVR